MINGPLLRHTLRSHRSRVLVVAAALALWGALLPVVYASFGRDLRAILESGLIPQAFLDLASNIGGGDIFSLPGSVALGFIHPFAVALNAVYAVGFAAAAVAGERQRGTLKVLLARPISRRSVHLTLFVTILMVVALTVGAQLAATVVSSSLLGVLDELDAATLPVLWLNGVLLFGAFGAIGLAASVSNDRLTPAVGATLALFLVSYVLEVLGSIWPDAEGIQPFSLFHYLQPQHVLSGQADPVSFVVLAAVGAAAVAYALVAFPRRDLAAPS